MHVFLAFCHSTVILGNCNHHIVEVTTNVKCMGTNYDITKTPYWGKRRSVVTTGIFSVNAVAIMNRSAGSRWICGSSVALNITSSVKGARLTPYFALKRERSLRGGIGRTIPPSCHLSEISHSVIGLTHKSSAARMASRVSLEKRPNSPLASHKTAHVSRSSRRIACLPISRSVSKQVTVDFYLPAVSVISFCHATKH